jgi:hypothetical protein
MPQYKKENTPQEMLQAAEMLGNGYSQNKTVLEPEGCEKWIQGRTKLVVCVMPCNGFGCQKQSRWVFVCICRLEIIHGQAGREVGQAPASCRSLRRTCDACVKQHAAHRVSHDTSQVRRQE